MEDKIENQGKKKIKVDFEGSGVKTLEGVGMILMIIGIISILTSAIGVLVFISGENTTGIYVASSFFPISIGSFAGGAICLGLSSIAKTALYKRLILEEQYDFFVPELANKITEEKASSGGEGMSDFSVGEIIVDKYTKTQLKITKILQDGKCVCEDKDGNSAGPYLSIGLSKVSSEDIESYWN